MKTFPEIELILSSCPFLPHMGVLHVPNAIDSLENTPGLTQSRPGSGFLKLAQTPSQLCSHSSELNQILCEQIQFYEKHSFKLSSVLCKM